MIQDILLEILAYAIMFIAIASLFIAVCIDKN